MGANDILFKLLSDGWEVKMYTTDFTYANEPIQRRLDIRCKKDERVIGTAFMISEGSNIYKETQYLLALEAIDRCVKNELGTPAQSLGD